MAINPNTTFVANAVLPASQMNRLPFGIVALATNTTANQPTITTKVDLTGMSVTWTAIANRNYKITYHIYAIPTTTNACFSVNLQQSTTVKQISITNGGVATAGTTCNGIYISSFSAGSTTLKLTGATTAGSLGSFTFAADATLPWILCVEDIGPA